MYTFNEIMDNMVKKGRMFYPFPDTKLPLSGLQSLADTYSERFVWIPQIPLVEEFDQYNGQLFPATGGRVAIAALACEEYNGKFYEHRIEFYHKEALTVGFLLHELAHLKDPLDDHGDVWKETYEHMINFWNNVVQS